MDKRVEELDALAEKATPGPYFVADDCADDTIAHRNTGLALIDTGRTGDDEWPVLRLGEWGTTNFVAALLNAWHDGWLRDAALRGLESGERQEDVTCKPQSQPGQRD